MPACVARVYMFSASDLCVPHWTHSSRKSPHRYPWRIPMKSHRIAISVTVLNAALLVSLIANQVQTHAATKEELPVLRGRALEIVDDEGRVRASIVVHGPEKKNGTEY